MVTILGLIAVFIECLWEQQHHGLLVARYFICKYVQNRHCMEKACEKIRTYTYHLHTLVTNNKKSMLEVLQPADFSKNTKDTLSVPISSSC